jgi:membrane protein YdbS with pleckstrin-like domain
MAPPEGATLFEWLKSTVLRLMRVPHEPEPPAGAPGSLRVFRAGESHYRLRVLRWALGQSGALIGIGFSLVFLGAFESGIERARVSAQAEAAPSPAAATPAAEAPPAVASAPGPTQSPSPSARTSRSERREARDRAIRAGFLRVSGVLIPFIWFLEIGGMIAFAAQLLVTYALVRLEFEQHWYIVTDRSLRIRTGILRLQESTMSFANVQQVEIRQGPVQRFLGLADVCVRSAGGGETGAAAEGHGVDTSLHTGVFEGVTNAEEIRNLILARLRAFREAGLGDPDEATFASALPAVRGGVSPVTAAAALALEEARALRQTVQRR